jgi:hypothetical protein
MFLFHAATVVPHRDGEMSERRWLLTILELRGSRAAAFAILEVRECNFVVQSNQERSASRTSHGTERVRQEHSP